MVLEHAIDESVYRGIVKVGVDVQGFLSALVNAMNVVSRRIKE